MKYNAVIQRKLALLDEHLLRLQENLKDISYETFANSWEKRWMAERALQIMIEIVIDICQRLIAIENAGPVATATGAIEKLMKLGILKSIEPYATMVKFRNLIVYQCEEIDTSPAFVFKIATNKLHDFRPFRNEIDIAAAHDQA